MFAFFDWVTEFFTNLWNFVVTLIEAIANLLYYIPLSVSMGPYLSGIVPTVIGSCIVVTISISVAKLISGRT